MNNHRVSSLHAVMVLVHMVQGAFFGCIKTTRIYLVNFLYAYFIPYRPPLLPTLSTTIPIQPAGASRVDKQTDLECRSFELNAIFSHHCLKEQNLILII